MIILSVQKVKYPFILLFGPKNVQHYRTTKKGPSSTKHIFELGQDKEMGFSPLFVNSLINNQYNMYPSFLWLDKTHYIAIRPSKSEEKNTAKMGLVFFNVSLNPSSFHAKKWVGVGINHKHKHKVEQNFSQPSHPTPTP